MLLLFLLLIAYLENIFFIDYSTVKSAPYKKMFSRNYSYFYIYEVTLVYASLKKKCLRSYIEADFLIKSFLHILSVV